MNKTRIPQCPLAYRTRRLHINASRIAAIYVQRDFKPKNGKQNLCGCTVLVTGIVAEDESEIFVEHSIQLHKNLNTNSDISLRKYYQADNDNVPLK